MSSDFEFKIIRGKGGYRDDKKVKSLGEVLAMNKESEHCAELRVLCC